MHVDTVIAGNGGCGLCTPKETGSCITAEYIGIPSVIIAGPGFADQAYYTAYNNSVPVMRVAVYPGAFATHTNEELIRNTRKILWPQIVEALTKPITQEELDRSAHIKKAEHAAMTDTPPWYDSDAQQISTIPTIQAGATAYLITGDAAHNKVQTMPGGGSATVKIELPIIWDRLMEVLGYVPLKSFFS